MYTVEEKESSTALAGFRLSPQQRQIWRQQPAAIAYGAQCSIRLTGRLDTEALRTAIAGVVDQYEILRTSFQRQPGMRTPVQVICKQPALSWHESDLINHDADSQQRQIVVACEADQRERVRERDSSGAVLRVSVLRFAAEDHVVVLTLPRLCADHTSLSLLISEIARAYDECLSGEIEPGESLQYADFCEWQNELAESDDAEAGRAFWLNQQAVSTPVRLPFETEGVSTTARERLSFTFAPEISSGLIRLADDHGLSRQTVLLTCWQVLLRRLCGQESFYINCLFEGRNYDELNSAIGLFARSLPLFCRLHDEQTLVSLGHEIEDRCSQMSEWQEYYGGEAEAQTDQISFEYFERVSHRVTVGGLKWRVLDQQSDLQQAKLGLRCERIDESEVKGEISYDSQVYLRSDIEWLIERLQTIVKSVIKDVTQNVAEVAIVSEREWKYLVKELAQTGEQDVLVEEDQSIVSLFEATVQRHASRVAIVCAQEELTYGDLNRRANQLARFLRARGVGPDVNVALFVERKINAFV
ncbi:MAG TPA: condensation domain-containing protein, partial [Pyrinomonadaceae bacterium]|nr:condensation domain-containing protein [Pyrinomonadaceae bacterium]